MFNKFQDFLKKRESIENLPQDINGYLMWYKNSIQKLGNADVFLKDGKKIRVNGLGSTGPWENLDVYDASNEFFEPYNMNPSGRNSSLENLKNMRYKAPESLTAGERESLKRYSDIDLSSSNKINHYYVPVDVVDEFIRKHGGIDYSKVQA